MQVTAGADLGGDMAAALAAGAILFNASDGTYATRLLDAARRCYAFAEASDGAKAVCQSPSVAAAYPSSYVPSHVMHLPRLPVEVVGTMKYRGDG